MSRRRSGCLDPECDTDFGADIWYEFHTGSEVCGWLTIDSCENGTYDGIAAMYRSIHKIYNI